ncbi:imidazolonepropionase [Eudoraea adriatica]|uniref:imidazolonepropionase n=1 Tax=Eudoraea adriatica TaxID=446681 RepID=UPI00037EA341|nr:imidazolonepropionase [Eudoraea adriatica]
MKELILIGPLSQVITMTGIPLKGPVSDNQLQLIEDAGIFCEDGLVKSIDKYKKLLSELKDVDVQLIQLEGNHICLPGFVDSHTHICFGGSRARDYAMRNAGKTYLEIAEEGGGIWDTVQQTRKATQKELVRGILKRAKQHLKNGVTTIEVKSGYGLSVEEELKMLKAIKEADNHYPLDFISTCLAAHMLPRDFNGSSSEYLSEISDQLFPILKKDKLANRVDAFIEKGAFNEADITPYLTKAVEMGFDITIHADQFSVGGSAVAVKFNAVSADHLEASTSYEIELLAKSNVIATALPGASLGLGCNFTPARKILDAGGSLVIASDHNPGSAPMGDLLTQAAILGTMEKLTNAEVLAGITFRAAAALKLANRGKLQQGYFADFSLFHTSDFNEVLYNQGSFKPCMVFKKGKLIYDKHKP